MSKSYNRILRINKKSAVIIVIALITVFFSAKIFLAASKNKSEKYTVLAREVKDVPQVVEFFSFHCGACYSFSQKMHVPEALKTMLPDNIPLKKYHISGMGVDGEYLTEAWAVAVVLNIEDAFEKNLFNRIMVNNEKDIPLAVVSAFLENGISESYFNAVRKMPQTINFVKQQNEAASKFRVQSIPAIYVSGRFKVNQHAIAGENIQQYSQNLAAEIEGLLKQ